MTRCDLRACAFSIFVRVDIAQLLNSPRQLEEAWREGGEDVAEFWESVGERFVYVGFVAGRDGAGE